MHIYFYDSEIIMKSSPHLPKMYGNIFTKAQSNGYLHVALWQSCVWRGLRSSADSVLTFKFESEMQSGRLLVCIIRWKDLELGTMQFHCKYNRRKINWLIVLAGLLNTASLSPISHYLGRRKSNGIYRVYKAWPGIMDNCSWKRRKCLE